jgi:hypothetical protein
MEKTVVVCQTEVEIGTIRRGQPSYRRAVAWAQCTLVEGHNPVQVLYPADSGDGAKERAIAEAKLYAKEKGLAYAGVLQHRTL